MCRPTFTKEEWAALGAKDLETHDYIQVNGHTFELVKLQVGDNQAARHMKRQQRREWYRGSSRNGVGDKCARLVTTWAKEEEATEAVRAKRTAQRARAAARRAQAEAEAADRHHFDDDDGMEEGEEEGDPYAYGSDDDEAMDDDL